MTTFQREACASMLRRKSRIFSTDDARRGARRRLPRLVFDFVDGAAGREVGRDRNTARIDDILLQPRVMAKVSERSLETHFLGRRFDLPVGIAPMGMCNLVCPNADRIMARAARARGFPVCLSSAGSSTMEEMKRWAGENAWFQMYFGQTAETTFASVDRARAAGYDTLILTVDVPQVSRRIRDQRNGFNVPFRLSVRSFIDFATHPRWSLSTLLAGIPSPKNFGGAGHQARFDRKASRAGADWQFLEQLRDRWQGKLIVKGVTAPEDAIRIRNAGADAIYVSNHGARQLDAAPAAIDLLPIIRQAVGPAFPLLFDSGVRSGEDVVRALAMGADFVMFGRPALFALGADGNAGLDALMDGFAEDISVAMAQVGAQTITDIGPHCLFNPASPLVDAVRTHGCAPVRVATKT